MHGYTLETVQRAKYLGVHLYHKLNWNTRINKMVNKARLTSSFIHWYLRKSPEFTKEFAYKSVIQPVMEYGSIMWDPHTQENINKTEMVQKKSGPLCKELIRQNR